MNPSNEVFSPTQSSIYFTVLTSLLPYIPLGVYQASSASGTVAVTWQRSSVKDGQSTTHTPILISEVIIQQCQLLLLDNYVRGVFNACIPFVSIVIAGGDGDLDKLLATKTETDEQYENDLSKISTLSTKSLAAQEARKRESGLLDFGDSKKALAFWKHRSSKWAKNIQKGMSSFFDLDVPPAKTPCAPVGEGMLVNLSTVSRDLASGDSKTKPSHSIIEDTRKADVQAKTLVPKEPKEDPKQFYDLFLVLSRLYGGILARWGGYGVDKFSLKLESNVGLQHRQVIEASQKTEACIMSLLNTLCFSTGILKSSWAVLQCKKPDLDFNEQIRSLTDANPGKDKMPVRALQITTALGSKNSSATGISHIDPPPDGPLLLYIFSLCIAHTLVITDDTEIHELDQPIQKHQLRRCIVLMRKFLYRSCWLDDVLPSLRRGSQNWSSNYFGVSLIASVVRTMREMHDRSSRRLLCAPDLWVVDDLLEKELSKCKKYEECTGLLQMQLLRRCPFLVPFKRRLKLFERIVTTNRVMIQGSNENQNLKPGVHVRIMRGRVLEDGLAHLNKLGRDLRQRIVVSYYNQAGATESGLDVGGLFKEFWSDLSTLAFDQNYALFRVTEGGDNCLYPNPSSGAAHGRDHVILFEFLGRILGKAIYEGITINPQFAHFFLAFLRGDYNFLHMLPDLVTMDPQLYQNLMFLKSYRGNAADLSLNFTVVIDDFGGNVEIPLIPNGANIEVTNANKQRYVGLIAKYHVCDRIREQSEAFTKGLWDVIDRSWLQLFDPNELQVLISGSSEGKLDVSEMRSHTRYAGFTPLDITVHRFWNVVAKLSVKNQKDLLRFVTSCERPPPLGFASMNPPFTLQKIVIDHDGDKLPSASTCFNTLKLPTYSSEKVLMERLIYSIESGAGFELT